MTPTNRAAPAALDDASPVAPARKSQPRGQRSAHKLMEAAVSLFLEKSVDSTTVDDIVLRAGIGKGTFYHHYQSKAALFAAMSEQVIGDFEARVAAALAACPPEDLWLQLDTWIKVACDSYLKMDPLRDLVFGSESLRWTASDRKFMKDLTALLQRGHERGVWHVEHPHLAATFVFRGLLGVIDDQVLAGKHPATAASGVITLMRHALARPAQ